MTAKLPQTLQRHLPELVDGLRPYLIPNVTAYQALAHSLGVSVSLVSQRTQAERRRRTGVVGPMPPGGVSPNVAVGRRPAPVWVEPDPMPTDEEARLRAALEAAARGETP